jgi:hypothetical protein
LKQPHTLVYGCHTHRYQHSAEWLHGVLHPSHSTVFQAQCVSLAIASTGLQAHCLSRFSVCTLGWVGVEIGCTWAVGRHGRRMPTPATAQHSMIMPVLPPCPPVQVVKTPAACGRGLLLCTGSAVWWHPACTVVTTCLRVLASVLWAVCAGGGGFCGLGETLPLCQKFKVVKFIKQTEEAQQLNMRHALV